MNGNQEVLETAPQSAKNTLGETLKFALIALAIVIPVRLFIAQPFIVSGASMEPTFDDAQYLIVDELSYRLHEPARGDVVIFRPPKDPSKFYIKRVIGLPNETVLIKSGIITIINKENPDGMRLNEPYLENKKEETASYELADDEYFVLGDNRSASSDSRTWGPIHREVIIGRPFVSLYPVNTASILPGQHRYDTNQN